MKCSIFSIFLLFSISLLHAQTVEEMDTLIRRFDHQLTIFPQEKIYVHTDKPYYLSGEKIWFRAYLADAVTHMPAPLSRYVYVELINPLDSVVSRVKIRSEEDAYYGHLLVPDGIPQGDYTLRAYTLFMRSQDEHYFFTKNIHIGDPQARTIHTDTRFFFESNRRVHVIFRFSGVHTSVPFVPKSVAVSVNNGKPMNVKVEEDGTATINFTLPVTSRQRTLLLEVMTSSLYRQFIQIPTPDNDFDVSFYPEGGSLMLGTLCRVVFKAIKSNGQSMNITGRVYDHSGTEMEAFKSDYLGMGNFLLLPEKGKSYYAVCENEKGESKRFDLPPAIDNGYALSVNQFKDKIYVSVLKPAEATQNEELFLFAHTRGMIHFIDSWDHAKNFAMISKEQFPSGVVHFTLFDTGLNPVSERLLFINNEDGAQIACQSDRENFAPRSLVKNSVIITNSDGQPLTGNFSVSVTSDREIAPDSTSNILTQLLLTSDLRGHIENPAFYFQHTPASTLALDLLMCTQGWRRYNMAGLAQGRFSRPTYPLELGPVVSGTVKSVLLGKSVKDEKVIVFSLAGNYFNSAQTDKEGRFYLPINELPDSTSFIVSVKPKRSTTRMDLILHNETFPDRTLSTVPLVEPDKNQFTRYADKADRHYLNEGGLRATQLAAAVVTANRTPPIRSPLYTPNIFRTITQEQLDKAGARDIYDMLNQLPGVQIVRNTRRRLVTRDQPSINDPPSIGVSSGPLLLINGVATDVAFLDVIDLFFIAQIDVLTGPETDIFGSRGGGNVIAIYTKGGEDLGAITSKPFHIKTLSPLGYQQPVAFYAPKYETETQRNNPKPDLRTTIHWQPVVQIDSAGVASFEFYTADEPTSYTVIMEGLATDGTIIRKEGKIGAFNPLFSILLRKE